MTTAKRGERSRKDYRSHGSDDLSLKPSKKVFQVKDGGRNVLLTPIVAPSTPMFSQTGLVQHQYVHFDKEVGVPLECDKIYIVSMVQI